MELAIERLETPSPAKLPLEIAERKGLGHPDTRAETAIIASCSESSCWCDGILPKMRLTHAVN